MCNCSYQSKSSLAGGDSNLSRIQEYRAPRANDGTVRAKWIFTSLIGAITRQSNSLAWRKSFIFLGLFIGFVTATRPISSFASQNVVLTWNQSSDPIVAGYNIYYGGASGVYTNVIDAGTSTSVTISNLVEETTYYFALTTYTAAGAASAFSGEVSYTVPVPANKPPKLNPVNNLTVNANSGVQTVNLTGISSGSPGGNQILTVTAISSDTNLVSNPTVNYISTNGSAVLTFSPTGNTNGSATITVTVDNGGASNNIIARSFVVAVGLVTERLHRMPGGQMVLTVSGPVGGSHVIQTSTDLVHWAPFSTNTIPPGGSVDIVDLNPNSPQKFYRAAPFAVTAPLTPTQSNFKMGNGVFSFTLSGVAGTYVVQWSANLLDWTSFSTNVIPPSGSVQVVDPNPTSAMKTYRAVPLAGSVQPAPLLSGFKRGNGVFSFALNGQPGNAARRAAKQATPAARREHRSDDGKNDHHKGEYAPERQFAPQPAAIDDRIGIQRHGSAPRIKSSL